MTEAITAAITVVLAAIIYSDLRHMRIPDRFSALLLGLFLLLIFVTPPAEIAFRIAQALCVFLVCFAGYYFRLLGGGDVKILAALSLFAPPHHASDILLVFSATLIGGTTLVVLARRLSSGSASDWAYLSSAKLPMGVPIGLAGLIVVGWWMIAGGS